MRSVHLPIGFVVAAVGFLAPARPIRAEAPAAAEAPGRTGELEARLQALEARYEAMERRHAEAYDALSKKYDALQKAVVAPPATAPTRAPTPGRDGSGAGDSSGPPRRSGGAGARTPGGAASATDSGRNEDGLGAEGTGGRTAVRESGASTISNARPPARKLEVEARDGLEFRSADGDFKLVFHDLTQAEYRAFSPTDLGPLRDGFFIPRQRWYFVGQVARDVEFYTAINRGYGSLDLLDAFITLNFLESLDGGTTGDSGGGAQGTGGRTTVNRGREPNRKLRLRIGRTKTPYLYEYFEIAEGDLIAPERSLYASNLSGNRQDGAMALGDLFRDRVNYAAGVFNGPRRSFIDSNNAKDLFTYLNVRPFLRSDRFEALKYLNLGGSFNAGFEQGTPQPAVFRTANDQTPSADASLLSPTFLAFNKDVVESGQRDQWSAHAVLYRKSLGLLAEYGGGFQNYSTRSDATGRVRVPFDGMTFQAFYFLTGEELTRRVNVVQPKRNFGFHKGEFGPGAVEVHARYSALALDRKIFTDGLADPNLWTNRAETFDVGVNWYLNYYTKVYFDWQHALFGDPVQFAPGRSSSMHTDLFWLRLQLFF